MIMQNLILKMLFSRSVTDNIIKSVQYTFIIKTISLKNLDLKTWDDVNAKLKQNIRHLILQDKFVASHSMQEWS